MTNDAKTGAAAINYWFVGAGALALLGTGVHIFAGGPEIMTPLYASNVPRMTIAVMDVIWWQVSAMLLGTTFACAIAAFRNEWRKPVAYLVGGHFVLIGVAFLGLGAQWFSSPWPMPQWVLFLGMAALMFAGMRRARR